MSDQQHWQEYATNATTEATKVDALFAVTQEFPTPITAPNVQF